MAEVDTGGGDCGEGARSPLGPDVPGLRLPPEGDLGDAPVLPLQRPPHRLPPRDLDDLDIVTGAPEIQYLGQKEPKAICILSADFKFDSNC